MLLNAYFLAQSVSQDPETWRSWCVWGIASSDGLPGDTSAQGGQPRPRLGILCSLPKKAHRTFSPEKAFSLPSHSLALLYFQVLTTSCLNYYKKLPAMPA